MSFDWKKHAECPSVRPLRTHLDCNAERAEMIAEGERLRASAASLVETLKQIEALGCRNCEAQEIAGGALAYAPHQHDLGLMNRDLKAENERLQAEVQGWKESALFAEGSLKKLEAEPFTKVTVDEYAVKP